MADVPNRVPIETWSASVSSRRAFLACIAAGSASLVACGPSDALNPDPGGGIARLTARPSAPSSLATPGSYLLNESNPNDGTLFIPDNVTPGTPRALMIALHGAGQGAVSMLNVWRPHAQAHGVLLLVPGARGLTWDVMSYRFSYDVTFINSALQFAFSRCAIDPAHIVLEGFSDGASYALALGLANGDLVTHVVGNSPGFVPRSDSPDVGKPKFLLTHGKQDGVLNIDRSSRSIVTGLRSGGYDASLTEFDGGHEMPPSIRDQSLTWALA